MNTQDMERVNRERNLQNEIAWLRRKINHLQNDGTRKTHTKEIADLNRQISDKLKALQPETVED